MNELGWILFILSSLLVAVLSVIFEMDDYLILGIFGVVLFLLFSTLFPTTDLKSDNQENKVYFKAVLKDGSIKTADKCYEQNNKSVCVFSGFISPEEKVVEDYWIDK